MRRRKTLGLSAAVLIAAAAVGLAAGYALNGQTQQARAELAEAQRLNPAYASLERIAKSTWFDDPKIRALAEATYFPGLREAGLAEE